MADVFVSYVSEDRATAKKRGLEGAGFFGLVGSPDDGLST